MTQRRRSSGRPRRAATGPSRPTASRSRRPRSATRSRRRSTTTSGTRRPQRSGRLHGLLQRRPFAATLLVVIALLVAMAWSPLRSYSAAAARVEALQSTRDRLEEEVARLEERRIALQDPEEIELLARRQHGLVRPGEVPFIVVTEEPQPEVGDPAAVTEGDPDAWWRDLVERAAALLP